MFYLQDLPDDETLHKFAGRYANMDVSAVKSCLILLRTGSDVLTGFELMLNRYGLSQGRFLTLIVMYRTPDVPANPSELAEKIGVTRATMTGLLDKLEKDQFIERHTDAEDRRKIYIRLTLKGISILEQMLPDYYDRISGLMKNLSEDERYQLTFLLQKVNTGLPALTEGYRLPGK
ncbi:MAG: MarR family transcriptional regulator [Desulfobacterales bacterium]|nr:MarR family transcriptional regulator [Desulfobacterales bacterium]